MQKMFDVELGKVTALTLKCSTNILESELDENEPDLKETKSSQLENLICNPNILNHNGMNNHEYVLDYKEKENFIPPANFTLTKNTHGNNANPRNTMLRSSTTPFLSEGTTNFKNLHPTTQNLNKVY